MRRPSEEVLLEVAKKFGEQPRLADRAAQRRSRSEKRWLREEKCLREETAGEEIAQRRGRSETGRPTEENGQKRGSLHHASEAAQGRVVSGKIWFTEGNDQKGCRA